MTICLQLVRRGDALSICGHATDPHGCPFHGTSPAGGTPMPRPVITTHGGAQ